MSSLKNTPTNFPERKDNLSVLVGCLVAIPLIIVVISGVSAFASVALMWSWGLFVNPIFGLPLLSFQQAFGAIIFLIILRTFLFGFYNTGKGKKW